MGAESNELALGEAAHGITGVRVVGEPRHADEGWRSEADLTGVMTGQRFPRYEPAMTADLAAIDLDGGVGGGPERFG